MLPCSKCTCTHPHTQERKKGAKERDGERKKEKCKEEKERKENIKRKFQLDSYKTIHSFKNTEYIIC